MSRWMFFYLFPVLPFLASVSCFCLGDLQLGGVIIC